MNWQYVHDYGNRPIKERRIYLHPTKGLLYISKMEELDQGNGLLAIERCTKGKAELRGSLVDLRKFSRRLLGMRNDEILIRIQESDSKDLREWLQWQARWMSDSPFKDDLPRSQFKEKLAQFT